MAYAVMLDSAALYDDTQLHTTTFIRTLIDLTTQQQYAVVNWHYLGGTVAYSASGGPSGNGYTRITGSTSFLHHDFNGTGETIPVFGQIGQRIRVPVLPSSGVLLRIWSGYRTSYTIGAAYRAGIFVDVDSTGTLHVNDGTGLPGGFVANNVTTSGATIQANTWHWLEMRWRNNNSSQDALSIALDGVVIGDWPARTDFCLERPAGVPLQSEGWFIGGDPINERNVHALAIDVSDTYFLEDATVDGSSFGELAPAWYGVDAQVLARLANEPGPVDTGDFTVTGAATAWEATDEAPSDGDSSYVSGPNRVGVPGPASTLAIDVAPFPRKPVAYQWAGYHAAFAGSPQLWSLYVRRGGAAQRSLTNIGNGYDAGYQHRYCAPLTYDPYDFSAITQSALNAIEWGWRVFSGTNATGWRLSQWAVEALTVPVSPARSRAFLLA